MTVLAFLLPLLCMLVWLVVMRWRHAAPQRHCTAQHPMPAGEDSAAAAAAGAARVTWVHKDLDPLPPDENLDTEKTNSLRTRYRCRYCGMVIVHIDD